VLKLVVANPPLDDSNAVSDSHTDFSPHSIVTRIQGGDKAAESELVSFYSDKLMFILSRKFNDRQLVLDTHQETFATVILKIRNGTIREPDKLTGFIRSTAVNLALMSIRKNKRMLTSSDSPIIENICDNQSSAYQDIEQQELTSMVMCLINELKVERDRTIIISFYITQLDKSQICQQLNLSPDHFDKVIYRAKQRLKNLILHRKKSSIITSVQQWVRGHIKGEQHD